MRRLVFLLVLALASAAQAAVETTTVQGKVVLPNGASATGGVITASLSQPGTTPDTTSGADQRVGGRASGTIGASGDVTLVLVPNDAIAPTGTYYQVRISTTGPVRASWVELWSVTTSPDPVDVGAITRLQVASGITVGNYVVYVDTEPSGSCTLNDTPRYATDTHKHCECVATVWTCTSAGGGSSGFADITSGTNTTAAMVVGTGASLATSGSGVNTANALATGDYGDWSVSAGVATIDADAVALGTDTTGGYAASATEGGPATTATALAANGADCSAGNYPLGVDASGAVENCTADDDVPEAGDFGAATDLDANGAVVAGGVGASELGDDIPCTGGQAIRRNGGDSAWECFTPGAASGDIEAVGDCATGACFDGTAGTTLTFNNVGGDATLDYDGTDFSFSKPITIAQDTSPGYVDLMEGSAGGTDALRLQAPTTVTASGYTCTFLDSQDMVPDTCVGGILSDESIALTTETSGNYVGTVADGTGIDGTAAAEGATYTPTLDLTEVNTTGSPGVTWGDSTAATVTHTFDVTGSTNPVWSYSDGVANLSAGTLQAGGVAVSTGTHTTDTTCEDSACALTDDTSSTAGADDNDTSIATTAFVQQELGNDTTFALLAGRAGGQTLVGGTGAGDDLTLQTTSNASKGSYILSELDCSSGDQYLTTNATGVIACGTDDGGSETNNLETVTTGIAADEIPMGTAADTVVYKPMPTTGTNGCAGAGEALQYNTSTDAWICLTGLGAGGTVDSLVGDDDANPTTGADLHVDGGTRGIDTDTDGSVTLTITFDPTEVYSSGGTETWGDGGDASIVETFNVSTGTDPQITYTDGVVNVSTGELQEAGSAVATTAEALTGNCTAGPCFDGTSDGGTQHTYYNAGGNGTIGFDGSEFDVSHPINVAQQSTAGFYRFYEASANGSNYIDITGASAVGTNRSCTLEDNASPFGDTCVQNAITIDHSSTGTLTLDQTTGPTSEGVIAWDATNDELEIGETTTTAIFKQFGTFTDESICSAESTGNQVDCDQAMSATSAASTIPIAEADGDLDAAWIGQDQNYTWTGAHDFSTGAIEIENGTAPTLANAGEIALDTDVLSGTTGQGLMILHDGTTNPTYVVATTDTPADNEIPKFDSTTGTITWEADGGGGGGTAGMRRSLLNFATVPDTSGNVYSEPLTVHGSNDRWRQLVWTFTQGSSTQNCLYGSFSLPADYGSSPSVVVVWTSAATSGDVEWDFEYRPISGNDTESLDQASSGESNLGNDDNDTAPSAAFERLEYDMGALSGLADNDTIQFRFCRDEVDSGDTMADEALLVDLLLEYDQ